MIPSMSLSLQINQQPAKLGLEITRGKLEIRQPQAELEIVQHHLQMEIDQGPGQLSVDSEDARAALGCKSSQRMVADIVSQVRQIMLEEIGYIASVGDQLAGPNGGTIADIALQNTERGPMPIEDFGTASMANVHLTYTPHLTKIDWSGGGVTINSTPRPPEFSFTPGSVKPYLLQQNRLEFEVKGQYMNRTF